MERRIDMNEVSDGRLYKANDLVKADCGGCQGCGGGSGKGILHPGGGLQQGDPVVGAHLHIPPCPQGEPQYRRQQPNRNHACLHAVASFATQTTAPASSTVIKNTCRGEVSRRSFSCRFSQVRS